MRWTTRGDHALHLISLEQSLVYAGLIEGLPTDRTNGWKLDALRQRYPKGHLIEPEQTPIPWEGRYPFGRPQRLPSVQCVAQLRGPGFTDTVMYHSGLTLLWFQDDWAMPVAPHIVAAIEALDWAALAEEWEL